MPIRFNPRSSQAIYVQVMQQIKTQIASGKLKLGTQMPTVRQLAQELNLNPNTVARVYTQLIAEGVLAAQQGRGTYVHQIPALPQQRQQRRIALQTYIDECLRAAEHWAYDPPEIEKLWRERFAAWRKKQRAA